MYQSFLASISPAKLIAFFLLCALPILFAPFQSDDFFHLLLLSEMMPLPMQEDASLWGLFSLVQQGSDYQQAMMRHGVLPWYTGSDFHFTFWRPLAEISHWLDFQLFPFNAVWAHSHNLLWFIALALLLYRLCQQLALPKATALLAFAVFLLQSHHAPTIEWIANRNALMAAFFALLSFSCYLHFHDTQRKSFLACSLLCWVLAIASGEAALALAGYYFAYTLLLDKTTIRQKVLRLMPYVLLTLTWLLWYKNAGFGTGGSAIAYIDPFSQPMAFALSVLQKIPVYLFTAFSFVPAEVYSIADLLSAKLGLIYLGIMLLALLLLFGMVYPIIKEHTKAQFFLLGGMVSIIPFCSLPAQDRLLLIPSLGFCVVIAIVIQQTFSRDWHHLSGARALLLKVAAIALIVQHLILAPVLFAFTANVIRQDAESTKHLALSLPNTAANADQLIIFDSSVINSAVLKPIRIFADKPIPNEVVLLAAGNKPIIERISENHFTITKSQGFVSRFEQTFRNLSSQPFHQGDVIRIGQTELIIQTLNEQGQPVTIDVKLLAPFDSYQFVTESDGEFKTLSLPEVGQ